MEREEARKRAVVMMAFANGSDVQFYNGSTEQWEDLAPECVLFDSNTEYRIKPEPKYRPFKTHEECWNEARKHNDFPWIRYIDGGFTQIKNIGKNDVNVESNLEHPHTTYSFAMAYLTLTFNDGTPFGVKEE